jgi:CRP-like cAMP-binding protein
VWWVFPDKSQIFVSNIHPTDEAALWWIRMNDVKVLRRTGPETLPVVRARPFSTSSDRRSRIDNLLSSEEQAELAAIATVLNYQRIGGTVFSEGEDAHFLYAIESGFVKISRHDEDGHRQILAFMWHGDLFGLAEHGHYVNSAETVSPATIYRFPLQRLRRLLLRDPRLQLHLLTKALHDLRSAQRQILILGQSDAHRRLASFLFDFSQHPEIYDQKTHRLTLPLSRYDIADYLGTSPEHVARAFSSLERDRVLQRITPRIIEILDAAKLTELHNKWNKN